MIKIRTVAVIGANGTMGRNVAGIIASFGNAKVYLVSRTMEKSVQAAEHAVKSVRADSIRKNLVPMDYSGVADCIGESDWVFESVTEDLSVKQDIYDLILKHKKQDCIITTGTSGLSISRLSERFDEDSKKRFFGTHFFNPPYNLTLCEVIPSGDTDTSLLTEIKTYLRDTLRRSVVESKDKPAFIGNRIGFQFINRALQYAEKYKTQGGIDYIDTILGVHTGRAMLPLDTADFVGLDIHKAIVNNIEENTDDFANSTFTLPGFVADLINENKLGRKSKEGLYKMLKNPDGSRQLLVYDIGTKTYRDKRKYDIPFIAEMMKFIEVSEYKKAYEVLISNDSMEAVICKELLLDYIIYSLIISNEIASSADSADTAMATGFNWIPPLALIEVFGGKTVVAELVSKYVKNDKMYRNIDIDKLLSACKASAYDYRRFIRSK